MVVGTEERKLTSNKELGREAPSPQNTRHCPKIIKSTASHSTFPDEMGCADI